MSSQKRVFVRRVQTTVDEYQLVETSSSDVCYVDCDRGRAPLRCVEADKTVEFIVEDWREASPLEAAVLLTGKARDKGSTS